MAKKLSSVLGIDIGSESIKVCEVKSQGRDPVVTAMGVIATPEGAVDHTGIYNAEAVAVALKQVISESGAGVSAAVVTINGQASVLVRTLEVPKMNPTELKEHMQWEINRNIPFAESTVVSDFKPLGNDDPNSQNMDVVMAISPQSAIDTLVSCIKKAGKTTAAIDVEPLSLARLLQYNYSDQYNGSTICVVKIGSKTTSINMYKGAKLLMPRQVPIGGEMFTKAISDAFSVGLAEAEAMKREKLEIPEDAATMGAGGIGNFGGTGSTQEFQPYNPFSDEPLPAFSPLEDDNATVMGGLPTDPAAPPAGNLAPAGPVNEVFNAVAPVLEEFVSEIRRSVDYFRSRGGDLDAVLVCGGAANLKGLTEYLGKSLGISCDAFDPFRRLNANGRKLSQAFVEQHRADFAVAVGNGLYIFFD